MSLSPSFQRELIFERHKSWYATKKEGVMAYYRVSTIEQKKRLRDRYPNRGCPFCAERRPDGGEDKDEGISGVKENRKELKC